MRLNFCFNHKGQNLMEYAIIIGIVLIALSTMQTYIRRGIQAMIKVAADEMGTQEGGVDDEKWTTSEIHRVTGGKPAGAQEVPALAEGATQRIRMYTGGRQRRDIYTNSEVLPLAGGTESYVITEEIIE